MPGVPWGAEVAAGELSAGAVQFHAQSAVDVGVAPGSVGADPVVQFQFQFQGVSEPVGITTSWGSPGTTIATPRLSGFVTVSTEVRPVALASFSWVSRPSAPGLATRIETLTLLGESWVADAIELSAAEPPGPVMPWGEPEDEEMQSVSSAEHCARSWMTELAFSTSAELLGPLAGRSVTAASIRAGSTGAATAVDVLPCVTGASFPGLPTRIDTLTLTGVTWVEVAVGVATCVPVAGPVAPAAAVAVEVFVWWIGPFSPGLSTRTVVLMFAGSTCVEVAVAVAESCEEDEVGVGAVMVTVGVGLVSPAVSSGLVSTTVVPPLPSSVPGSISTVTPVACGSVLGRIPSYTRRLRVGICVSGSTRARVTTGLRVTTLPIDVRSRRARIRIRRRLAVW